MSGNGTDRQEGGAGGMARLLADLRKRAQLWMPDWRPADPGSDPADIVLRAAARTFSEVTSRLDMLPEKLFRDYLHWLGIIGQPGRAARIPLVFRLAPGAERVMLAGSRPGNDGAPVLLQAITPGDPVPFEIDAPVFLQSAALSMIIGAKPDEDFYTEAPAGLLTASGPAEGVDRWELVSAVAVDASSLQLRPTDGLAADMQLNDPSGARYRVKSAEDGLVEIDPPAKLALSPGQILRRAKEFDPFPAAGSVQDLEPNRQTHALYLGSMTALDVAAAATLEIVGKTPPSAIDWEYWGKTSDSDTPDWQELTVEPTGDRYILHKKAGAIEPLEIGGVTARWLRATVPPDRIPAKSKTTVAQLALRVNPGASGGGDVAYDAMAPTVQLVTDRPFLPFGREPRRFDSFHIGSSEAFSKPDACVHLDFELGDGFATAMSVAWLPNDVSVAAAIGNDGRLLRVVLSEATGEPAFLGPVQPSQNGHAVALSRKSRPGAATYNGRAVFAAGDGTTVWYWTTSEDDLEVGAWQDLGAPASGDLGDVILISEGEEQAPLRVYAVQGGVIHTRRADVNDAWSRHHVPENVPGPILRLSAVDDVDSLHGQQPLTTMLAAIAENGQLGLIDGQSWTEIKGAPKCDPGGYPQVIWDPEEEELVAAFGKVAAEEKANPSDDDPPTKIFAVDISTEKRVLEVDLIGQAMAPLRLDADDSRGAIFAARKADGTTALHLWSPFVGGFVQVADPVPVSSRYVQSPVPMTPDGLWLCPRFSGSVGVTRVIEGTVDAADVVRCLLLPAGDPTEDWTNRLMRVPAEAASLMRVSFAFAAPGGGALIVPDDSWELPPGGIRAESFRGETVKGMATGKQDKVEVPLTPEVGAFLADPANTSSEVFLGFRTAGKAWLIHARPELPATDPVVFRPAAGTPDFELSVPTEVVVCVRLQSNLTGRIVSVVEHRGQPGSRLALFDWDTQNPLDFDAVDNQQNTLLLLDTSDDVARVVWSETLGMQSQWSPPRPRNPALSWEYWNGSAWSTIGDLRDGTGNLVNSGEVRFCVPLDLAPTEVLGRPNSWIRARLVDGDYGSENVWVETDPAGKQRVVRDQGGISAPVVVRLSVRYSLNRAIPFAHVLTEDAGTLRDQTAANAAPNATIPLFMHLSDDLERQVVPQAGTPGASPDKGNQGLDCGGGAEHQALQAAIDSTDGPVPKRALFLGFDAPLSGAPVNLFFQIPREPAQVVQILEVWGLTLGGFQPIPAEDGTLGLSETGILSLDLQVPLEPTVLFGRQLYWLRLAPRASGSAESWDPRVTGIHLNAAWATAAETQSIELLGSSDASPGQRFMLARPPVVRDSLELRVRELLGPDEAAELAADQRGVPMVLDAIGTRAGPWVLWQAGDLTTTRPESRTYALDPVTGEIRFGDGAQGRIPPAGRDVIMAVRYRTGGTAAANAVAAWGQISLVSAVQGVEAVFAPEPAAGGSDPETVAEVLQTAPAGLAMRDRALTLRDFGRLALRASDEIGQAVAMIRPNGVVAVVIAMRGAQPMPSNAALRETTRFLQQRVSPTLARQGALVVVPARPLPVRIDVDAQVDAFENLGPVNAQIVLRILRLLDPATGGAHGDGWPFGTLPTPDDIAAATFDVPHLVVLTNIAIQPEGTPRLRVTPDAMVVASANRIRVRSRVGVQDDLNEVAR